MVSLLAAFGLVVTRIGVAISLKLMLGGDDFVFLAPFMARSRKWHLKVTIGLKYFASVVFLTLVACGIAESINVAADRMTDASLVDKIISSIAAALLMSYAFYMAWEEGWLRIPSAQKEVKATSYGTIAEAEDEEELSPFKQSIVDFVLSIDKMINRICCLGSKERPETESEKKLLAEENALDEETEQDETKGVIVVAFLASMDDFIVYFTLALSGQLAWYELAIGVMIGAALIAALVAILLESSDKLADFIEKVPIPFVLFGLALFIIISAWTGIPGHSMGSSHHHSSDGDSRRLLL